MTAELPRLHGVIPADALAEEQLSAGERCAERYIDADGEDGEALEDPSVLTLNSISAALAATDFLFMVTGPARRGDLEPASFTRRPGSCVSDRFTPSRVAASATRRPRRAR